MIDYEAKETVNLQEAVRNLHQRLLALETAGRVPHDPKTGEWIPVAPANSATKDPVTERVDAMLASATAPKWTPAAPK